MRRAGAVLIALFFSGPLAIPGGLGIVVFLFPVLRALEGPTGLHFVGREGPDDWVILGVTGILWVLLFWRIDVLQKEKRFFRRKPPPNLKS